MTQKYYIKDPTPIINYILDKCPTISVHRLQVLLFSFCKVYSANFKDISEQPKFFTDLQFETDPYTAVIPGLEKDLRTGKYKPETDDSIRTFGNISDFRAINLLHSHSIWEKALEQGYNKPFPQKLFLED